MAVSFIHEKDSCFGRHRRLPVVLSYLKNAPSNALFVQESQMQAGELTDWKIHFLLQGIRALSKGLSRPSTPPLAGSSSCWYGQQQGNGVCHVSCNSCSPFDYLLISKPHWGWAGLGRSLWGFPCSQLCNCSWAALQLSGLRGRCVWAGHGGRGCSGCHCCESQAFRQLGLLPLYISKCFLAWNKVLLSHFAY